MLNQESIKNTITQKQDGVYVEFSIDGKNSQTKQLFYIIDNKRFNSIDDINKVVKDKKYNGKLLADSPGKRTAKLNQFKRSLEKIQTHLKSTHFLERDILDETSNVQSHLTHNFNNLNKTEFSREIIKGFLLEVSKEWLKHIFNTQEIKNLIGNNFRFSDHDLETTLNEVRNNVLSDDYCDTFLAKHLVQLSNLNGNEASAPPMPSNNEASAPLMSSSYISYNKLDSFNRLKKAFIETIYCPIQVKNQTKAMIMANRLDEIGNQLKSLDLYEINPDNGELKLNQAGKPIKKEDFTK